MLYMLVDRCADITDNNIGHRYMVINLKLNMGMEIVNLRAPGTGGIFTEDYGGK